MRTVSLTSKAPPGNAKVISTLIGLSARALRLTHLNMPVDRTLATAEPNTPEALKGTPTPAFLSLLQQLVERFSLDNLAGNAVGLVEAVMIR